MGNVGENCIKHRYESLFNVIIIRACYRTNRLAKNGNCKSRFHLIQSFYAQTFDEKGRNLGRHC